MAEYGFLPRKKTYSTGAIHAGNQPEKWGPTWDIAPPIYMAVTYKQEAPGKPHNGYIYSRYGNPTRIALEECLAKLEDANYGLTFSSGMASCVAAVHLLTSGDGIIVGDELFGGTAKYFSKIAAKMGLTVDFFDAGELENVRKAMKPNTKLVWLETPSNPLLKIIDVREICKLVHDISKEAIVVVDNTWLTSYFQKPLDLGADISMASLTKYYNGHNDVTMGALITNRKDLYDQLKFNQIMLGAIPSPLDCYHLIRSLNTLSIRMEKHMKNGVAVAQFLENHPNVKQVLHPALKSHKQHDLAKKQSYGHSGMISFYLTRGAAEAEKFLTSLKLFNLATSLGDVGSLIAAPLTMIDVPPHQQADPTIINASLIRMSVGLEDEEDLINDLSQALKIAFTV